MRAAIPTLVSLAASAVALALPAIAHAEPMVGVDLDVALPTKVDGPAGAGFNMRFGNEIRIPWMTITPEINLSYYDFSQNYGPQVYRSTGGVRMAFGDVLRPGVFSHFGLGRFLPLAGDGQWTYEFDTGVSLDIVPVPYMNVGAHGSYNISSGKDFRGDGFNWFTLGAHVAVQF